MKLKKEEILRKILHIFALLIPAGIFYIPQYFNLSKWFPSIVLFIIVFLSVAIELVRLRNESVQRFVMQYFGAMMREKESSSITGSTYIIAAAFICSLAFVNRPEISFISLFIFVLGDAAAALVGIEFGRIKIKDKSLEGSFACFVVVFLILSCLFPYIPGILENFSGKFSLKELIQISFIVTILEFYSFKVFGWEINDNLYVPLVTGVAISFI